MGFQIESGAFVYVCGVGNDQRHPVYYTLEEYVAFEDSNPAKHEYLGGQIFAMAGAPRSTLGLPRPSAP